MFFCVVSVVLLVKFLKCLEQNLDSTVYHFLSYLIPFAFILNSCYIDIIWNISQYQSDASQGFSLLGNASSSRIFVGVVIHTIFKKWKVILVVSYYYFVSGGSCAHEILVTQTFITPQFLILLIQSVLQTLSAQTISSCYSFNLHSFAYYVSFFRPNVKYLHYLLVLIFLFIISFTIS